MEKLTEEEWDRIRIKAAIMILENNVSEAHELLESTFQNFDHPIDRGMEMIGMLFILGILTSSETLSSIPIPRMEGSSGAQV